MLRNTPTRTSQKIQSWSLKNASIFSTTIKVETSQLKNWLTPSELSVLKAKPNKSSVSFNLHHLLKRWTLLLSLKFSDSVEMEPVKPPLANFSNTLTLTNKELSVQKNSKELLLALDKTSQLLKSTKWSIMLIRTEMESLTSTNSPMSSPKNTQKSDLCKDLNIFLNKSSLFK